MFTTPAQGKKWEVKGEGGGSLTTTSIILLEKVTRERRNGEEGGISGSYLLLMSVSRKGDATPPLAFP